eukprot:1149447-Pelagomonas_calceolata.AAC.5
MILRTSRAQRGASGTTCVAPRKRRKEVQAALQVWPRLRRKEGQAAPCVGLVRPPCVAPQSQAQRGASGTTCGSYGCDTCMIVVQVRCMLCAVSWCVLVN